jgi:hypothetical protein
MLFHLKNFLGDIIRLIDKGDGGLESGLMWILHVEELESLLKGQMPNLRRHLSENRKLNCFSVDFCQRQ